MSDSLRSLVAQATIIQNALVDSGGQLTPEIESQLSDIDVRMPIKIDGYAVIMERLDLESDYWKQKADLYYQISKGCQLARERLRMSLRFAMDALEVEELKGVDVRFKLSRTKPALSINEQLLDSGYLIAKTISVPDKKRIEEDLKNGLSVEGAKLIESTSLRVYANKGNKDE